MRIQKPHSSLERLSQIIVPITSDATLVNDPVALVDSPSALVGGPTVPSGDIRASIKPLVPVAKLKIGR